MKRTLSFILSIILILSFVSCGGEMPEKTPEPTTPEAQTPEAVTPEENEQQDQADRIPYECVYAGVEIVNEYRYVKDYQIIVIRSQEELSPYVQRSQTEFDAFSEYVLRDENEHLSASMLEKASIFYNIMKAWKSYNTESFFQDNVLLLIIYSGGTSNIVTTDVSVKQTNGKKELHINQLLISEAVFGSDGSTYSVLMAMPSDLGVDFESDVIINRQKVYGSLYNSLGGTIMYPYTTQHWGWKWELPK